MKLKAIHAMLLIEMSKSIRIIHPSGSGNQTLDNIEDKQITFAITAYTKKWCSW